MGTICKKCGYERLPSDQAPDYECPMCEVVYEKAEADINRQMPMGASNGDADLYLKATQEVDSDRRDAALWAMVIVLADGNAEKARIQYIKLRVAQAAKRKIQDKVGGESLPKSQKINSRSQSALPLPQTGDSSRNDAGVFQKLKKSVARHKLLTIAVLLLLASVALRPTVSDVVNNYFRNRELASLGLAAEQGSSEAAYTLGQYYQSKMEFKKAQRWYLLAAKLGSRRALLIEALPAARSMEKSMRVQKDYCEEARKWVRYAAERGDAVAQTLLSRGEGCVKDGMVWLRKAAENGDAVAQAQLGREVVYGEEAIKWYRKAAEQGNTDAQVELGNIYNYGRYNAITIDYSEAFKWYQVAANQGDADGQFNLGFMYMGGTGVAKNDAEAIKWFYQAAKQGKAQAQAMLGAMYHEGHGVSQNYSEAVKWYGLAANNGDVLAQTELGMSYLKGEGVTQDYKEAARWLLLAAETGEPVTALAAYNLGMMYLYGQGVTKDSKEAVGWLRLAAVAGNPGAREELDKLGVTFEKGENGG